MKSPLFKEAFSFGLDFLEVYATFLNEDYFENLAIHGNGKIDYKHFLSFDCQYKKVHNYEYMIIFYSNNRPMFSYFKGKKGIQVPTKDYVVFYSSMFRKYGPKVVSHFLYENFVFVNNSIKRFDIYADFVADTETVLRTFYFRPQKTTTFTDENGKIESFYIGQVQNTKNKRNLIRIYNKIKEIRENEKSGLYQDYLLNGNVTRVELEIRRELAKNYTLEELFVIENQLGIMKNYFKKHTSIFNNIPLQSISLYQRPPEIDFHIIQANEKDIRLVKQYLGYARKLERMCICPVYLLLQFDVIMKNTKEILNDFSDYKEKMKELSEQGELWKQIVYLAEKRSYEQ